MEGPEPKQFTSLYRQLRPTKFSEIIGQPHVKRIMQNALASGKISHAYLFSGPRGTGKTTTAKILSKAVNCSQPDGVEPCNRCPSCIRIDKGYSMDVLEIDGASNRGIDEIRDLREKVKLAPAEEKFKVYIVDEVHMLTSEAFNALLKTLEEPPARTMFILATTQPHKVPDTIISRCQRFDFRKISQTEIEDYLTEVAKAQGTEIETEAVSLIAKMAGGGLRDALGIVEQCMAFGGGSGVLRADVEAVLGKAGDGVIDTMMRAVARGDVEGALSVVQESTAEGKDVSYIFHDILEYLRCLLILSTAKDAAQMIPFNDEIVASMKQQVNEFSTDSLFEMVDKVADYEQQLRWSSQPEIVLELAVIRLCEYGVLAGGVQPEAGRSVSSRKPAAKPAAERKEAAGEVVSGHTETAAAVGAAVEKENKKQTPEETVSQEETNGGDFISYGAVKTQWKDILGEIKKKRISLHAVLVEARVRQIENGILTIGFDSRLQFHKETVEQEKNKKLLEYYLHQYFERDIRVKCVTEKTLEDGGTDIPGEDPVVKRALDIFGGEIIEDGEQEGN